MTTSRRSFLASVAGGLAAAGCSSDPGVPLYVRYDHGGRTTYGLLQGDQVQPLHGDIFAENAPQGSPVPLSDVTLRYPVEPTKVLALAGNYRSHLGEDQAPSLYPQVFIKPITALTDPESDVVVPPDSKDLHFEAELVIVIGKKAKGISQQEAPGYIFGYTVGNDISERNWQNGSQGDPKDLQWWRAKGADTFAPLGPGIATNLNLAQAKIQLRQNGEVKQEQLLGDLIHGPAETVSFISQYVTLMPGDVIYTGTPGETSPIAPGDVLEVEIGGIGVLRNGVVAG